jgi:hypothetical protein
MMPMLRDKQSFDCTIQGFQLECMNSISTDPVAQATVRILLALQQQITAIEFNLKLSMPDTPQLAWSTVAHRLLFRFHFACASGNMEQLNTVSEFETAQAATRALLVTQVTPSPRAPRLKPIKRQARPTGGSKEPQALCHIHRQDNHTNLACRSQKHRWKGGDNENPQPTKQAKTEGK